MLSLFKFTAHQQLIGKQTISITWLYRHTRNVYKILKRAIRNVTVRGEGKTGVRNIYKHTHYTSTIHHLKAPEVHKYSKSSKMYCQYFVWVRLTKHVIFLKRFIAKKVCTACTSYQIVPLTIFNKYVHNDTSQYK